MPLSIGQPKGPSSCGVISRVVTNGAGHADRGLRKMPSRIASPSTNGPRLQRGFDPSEHRQHDRNGLSCGLAGEPGGERHAGFALLENEHRPAPPNRSSPPSRFARRRSDAARSFSQGRVQNRCRSPRFVTMVITAAPTLCRRSAERILQSLGGAYDIIQSLEASGPSRPAPRLPQTPRPT
jgi:hypothetical protein